MMNLLFCVPEEGRWVFLIFMAWSCSFLELASFLSCVKKKEVIVPVGKFPFKASKCILVKRVSLSWRVQRLVEPLIWDQPLWEVLEWVKCCKLSLYFIRSEGQALISASCNSRRIRGAPTSSRGYCTFLPSLCAHLC